MKFLSLFLVVFLCSCNWAGKKAKETVNKTGEVVAKTGSEFADGVAKGVQETFDNEVVLSDGLKGNIKTGRIIITGSDTTTDNKLSVYIIFEKDVDQNITVKAIDASGKEYGRKTEHVKGRKNDAGYLDFVFDRRTDIDGKGKLIFE